MPMTSYLRKKLGDHALGKTTYTKPTAVSLALFTASPTDTGSLAAEASGGSYARVEITSKMGAFDLTTGIAVNSNDVDFGVPTGNWGTLTYAGIMDDSSPNNMLYYEALPTARVVTTGSRRVLFATGQLQIQHV
jgi:hypothetical protein